MKFIYSTISILIPALASPAVAQNYRLDDGSAEISAEGTLAHSSQYGYMQAYSVEGGGSDVIKDISVVITTFWRPSVDGAPIVIAVWDDPNRDGNPSDAVLLGSYSGHSAYNTGTGLFVTYDFPQPVPVVDAFFIGIGVGVIGFPSPIGAIDSTGGYNYESYAFSNAMNPIDFANLDQNFSPPTSAFQFGRYLLRANDGLYEEALGSNFCGQSNANSGGSTGELYVNGNLDPGAGPFKAYLTAHKLPVGQFGFFLASQTPGPPVNPVSSQGTLCLGGSILRIKPSLGVVTASRVLSWDVDVRNVDSLGLSTAGFDVIASGQTWRFQCWTRDVNPGPTSNFTNGVYVTFQ